MRNHEEFPLVSGHLSLDLVNTELVQRGNRHDLLVTSEDLVSWIHAMEKAGALVPAVLPQGYDSPEALQVLLSLRDLLRRQFERVADGNKPEDSWKANLEKLVEEAPFSYKVRDKSLIPVPLGRPEHALSTLAAFDALRLLASGELLSLHRCANPDCVLLFMDTSGRRKWCSMRICGNRTKVSRHHARKENVKGSGDHEQ